MNIVRALQGVTFEWKRDGSPGVGLIAQDVEKVLPELVRMNKQGIKAIEYGNLLAPLIEAAKEQQNEIEVLRARVEDLESKLER